MDTLYSIKMSVGITTFLLGITNDKDKFFEDWFKNRDQYKDINYESDTKVTARNTFHDDKPVITTFFAKKLTPFNCMQILEGDARHYF